MLLLIRHLSANIMQYARYKNPIDLLFAATFTLSLILQCAKRMHIAQALIKKSSATSNYE